MSADRLAEVGKLAEAERSKIVKLLKLDESAPLVKGGLTLIRFAIKRANTASSSSTSKNARCRQGIVGHAHAKGPDLYAAFVRGGEQRRKVPVLVAEQIAAGMLLSLNNVPPWFAAGGGRTIAARVEPKSSLVKKWDGEVQNLSVPENADSLLSAEVVDTEAATRSYAFGAQPDAKAAAISIARLGTLAGARFRRGVDRSVSARRE